MKKRLFWATLVAALFLAVPAQAQLRFGIKAGVNISDLSLRGDLRDNFDADNITSFTGGVMGEFMFPLGLGFDFGVLYTRKSSELEFDFGKMEQVRVLYSDNIEIPINLKYRFTLPVVDKFLAPYVFAGPSFLFTVADNLKEFEGQIKSKSFETAINLGIGLELFKHVQVSGQYGWGLGNALEVSNDAAGSLVNGKSRAWTITAAYFF